MEPGVAVWHDDGQVCQIFEVGPLGGALDDPAAVGPEDLFQQNFGDDKK